MNTLHKSVVSAVLVILPVLSIAQGIDDNLSGNTGLTSADPLSSRLQTDIAPVLPGGLDYSSKLGLVSGTWESSINLSDSLELDLHGSYAGEFVNDLGYDLTAIYYNRYPSFGSGLSYTFGGNFEPTLGAGVLRSDNWSLDSDDSLYVYGDLGLTLPSDIGVGLQVGRRSLRGEDTVLDTSDWYVYNFSLTKSLMGMDFSLTYSDNAQKDIGCSGMNGSLTAVNPCDRRVIFSITGGF
jgi:uncharacterized protein (TIGR02001 family)